MSASDYRRIWTLLVVVSMLLTVMTMPVPTEAQSAGPLSGSFASSLAIRRVPLSDRTGEGGQALMLTPLGDTVGVANLAVESPAVHIVGWVEDDVLLVVQSTDGGSYDAVGYAPDGIATATFASGLPLDRRYTLMTSGAHVLAWPYDALAAAPFSDLQMYDAATMGLLNTFDFSTMNLAAMQLAGMDQDRVYFYGGPSQDIFVAFGLLQSSVNLPVDLLAAGDGSERVSEVSVLPGQLVTVVGRIDPKGLPGVYTIPMSQSDGSLAVSEFIGARALAAATNYPLDVGEVQRVRWSPDGSIAAVVSAFSGDFSGSQVHLVNAGFEMLSGEAVRAAFNACVTFTPDSRWLLYVSEDGGALMAVPADNPAATPQVLVSGEPLLDLCEASWQPAVQGGVDVASGAIAVGDVVTGTIDDDQFAVDYTIDLQTSETITVSMERMSGDLDTFLLLLGPNGEELARNDDAPVMVGDTTYNAQLRGFTASQAGTYTIRATRFFEENGASSGGFRLSVEAGEPEPIIDVTAEPLPMLIVGDVVSGTVDDSRAVNTYSLMLEAGQTVTITMERTTGDLDPYLALYGPDGSELISNDDAAAPLGDTSLNAQIVNFSVPVAGTYTIQASRYARQDGASSGQYQLSVSAGEEVIVTPGGGAISLGQTVTGEITDAQPRMPYTIQLEAGQTVTITMERTTGDLDPYLALYGPDGSELISNDDAAAPVGDSDLNAQIVNFSVPVAGTYTIEATRYAQEDGASSGQYQLSASAGEEIVITPGGGAISLGQTVTGEIADDQYRVPYTIALEVGQIVTITMERMAGDLDPYLALYGPDGSELISNDDAAAPVGDSNLNAQIVNFSPPVTGTYTIEATRYAQEGGASSGQYQLSASAGEEIVITPGGGPISLGQTVNSEITDAQPRVTYTIQLEAGQVVTITMERLSGELDSYLYLYGPDGSIITYNDDSGGAVGDTSLNSRIPNVTVTANGTYTIEATRYGQEDGSTTGTFSLSVVQGVEQVIGAGEALQIGSVVTNFIDDVQFAVEYPIALEAGQAVTISMERLSDSLDAYLILYDPGGNEVLRNDDSDVPVGDSGLNAQLAAYTAMTSGVYTVRATRLSAETGGSFGDYRLTVEAAEPVVFTPSGPIQLDQPVFNQISGEQPRIEYTIALEAGQTVTITMERASGDLDTYLALYGPGGAELAANDDADPSVGNSSLNAQIARFTAPSTGTYTILATRYGQEDGSSNGQFRLSASPSESMILTPVGPISVGQSVNNEITDAQARVQYTIALETGQTVTITMEQTSGDLDAYLYLYDPDGVEVAANDDAEYMVGKTSLNAQIANFTAPTTGTYTIEATRYVQESGSTSGQFQLSVASGAAVQPVEPGEALRVGGTVVGTISDASPRIDYALPLEAGQSVTVTMERTSGDLDSYLILYGPDGGELIYNDDAQAQVGDTSLNAQIVGFVAPSSGTYRVEASRFAQEGGLSSGQFRLTVASGQAGNGGGTGVLPGTIRVGDTVMGTISSTQPAVDYTVNLTSGQRITVTMQQTSGDLDSYLVILDAAGSEVAFNDDAAMEVGGSALNAQISSFTATVTGIYTIRATRYNQQDGMSAGDYQLSVMEAGASSGTDLTVEEGIAYAEPLNVGDTVTGEITGEVYAVEYPITLQAGQAIGVTMVATSGGLDPLLVIYDLNDDADAYNDDAAIQVGDNPYNAQIVSYTAPESGEYFIWATRYNLEEGDSDSVGTFQLQVTVADPVTAQSGGPVAIGANVTGALTATTFAVDYTISLQAGQVITVTMEALDDTLDPTLIIFDGAGNEQAYNDDADVQVGASSLNSQIPGFAAPVAGTYTIRATRYFQEGGSSLGRFNLSVTAGAPPDDSTSTK